MRKLRFICTTTNVVLYACKNCVLYAPQTHAYHMQANVNFLFLFGVLFIRIFMRPGSIITTKIKTACLDPHFSQNHSLRDMETTEAFRVIQCF